LLGAFFGGVTNWNIFWLGFAGLLFIVFACHFFDEVVDWKLGRDVNYGGMGIIRENMLTLSECYGIAVSFLVPAIGCGVLAILEVGLGLIPFLVLGFILLATNHIHETLPLIHDYAISLAFATVFLGSFYMQHLTLTLSTILFALFIFFIIVGFIPWQDLADYEEDKKHNKKTIIVKFGYENAGRICILHGIIGLTILVLYFLFA